MITENNEDIHVLYSFYQHQELWAGNTYCKRGKYFAKMLARPFKWGQFSRYFLIKVLWVLFSRGGNFHEEGLIAKNAKITPTQKFPRLQYYMDHNFYSVDIVNCLLFAFFFYFCCCYTMHWFEAFFNKICNKCALKLPILSVPDHRMCTCHKLVL